MSVSAYLLRCSYPGCRFRELIEDSPSACAEIGDAITGHLAPGHRIEVMAGAAGVRLAAGRRRYRWFEPTEP